MPSLLREPVTDAEVPVPLPKGLFTCHATGPPAKTPKMTTSLHAPGDPDPTPRKVRLSAPGCVLPGTTAPARER